MAKTGDALTFSSRATARDDAVEGFRDLYAAGARVEPTAPVVFASVRARLLPEMVLFERRIHGFSLTRDAALVRRTGFDHFVVQRVMRGEFRLDLGGDRKTLHAGDAVFLDTTRPFATEAVWCRFHTLSVPRTRLAAAGLDTSRLHGVGWRTGPAGLQVLTAALLDGDGDPAVWPRLLHPDPRSTPPGRHDEGTARQRRERALAYIEAHLHRSDLTPETVAAGAHVSRATLYRTFAELGGVSEWILARRLRRLRTALESELRPLAELVGQFGFVSLSHATRAFQARYGVPPGALRTGRRAAPPGADDPAATARRLLEDMPAALARSRRRSAA